MPSGQDCRRSTATAPPSGCRFMRHWLFRGGGKWSTHLRPLVRWAGAPWKPLVERCCCVKDITGLCPSLCFRCLRVSDVCTQCVTWMVSVSSFVDGSTSIRQPHILWKLSASCARWTACGRSYSSRCARVSRGVAPVQTVVGPVDGVKTHVSCSRNARGLRKSEYAVSLIHHTRPLNR